MLRKILTVNTNCLICIRGFKSKPKAANCKRTTKPSTIHALEHFDLFYKPVYGDLWRSMRLALLSQQKYCALLNNYASVQDTTIRLTCDGADDLIDFARRKCQALKQQDRPMVESVPTEGHENLFDPLPSQHSNYEPTIPLGADPQLYDFMPVKRVVSEHQKLLEEELEQNVLHKPKSDHSPLMSSNDPVYLPLHLKAFMFPMGDVRLFPEPTIDEQTHRLDYYTMDAASLLPVLALDLFPGCSVLDTCAAPGGKTLAMLQTMLPESVTCLDNSWSRLQRLKHILHLYMPRALTDQIVKVISTNAIKFCANNETTYDKILVDVPCFTDRHVANSNEENFFRPSQIRSRLALQGTQKDLLFWALHRVKPGGHVVYSTCTLSPAQNDGVIQQVIDQVWQQTKMDVVIQDTSSFCQIFGDAMHFYGKCRYGQLVVPKTTSNCGPMYFCKLKRVM